YIVDDQLDGSITIYQGFHRLKCYFFVFFLFNFQLRLMTIFFYDMNFLDGTNNVSEEQYNHAYADKNT
ncbi:hypothetical protein DXD61_10755, partial [Eubacterium sp. TM06-47]